MIAVAPDPVIEAEEVAIEKRCVPLVIKFSAYPSFVPKFA